MKPPVKLRDLTDALDLPQEWTAWLDRETGRVIPLDPDTQSAADSDDESAPNWLPAEALTAARAIADGDPHYLALPDAFDFHEYRHMERFVADQADAHIAEQLWRAIKGRDAFRHFKDTADRLGRLDDWYRYRDGAAARFMLDWAEAHGVTVDQTPPTSANP